jgi:monoamine oxidase
MVNETLDVAIIGAGAAGVGAARRLAASGLNVLLVEASSRIGGRAFTVEIDGLPLDLGCGWLHSADRNPWTTIADDAGIAVDRHNPPWGRSIPRPGFSVQEQEEARAAYDQWHDRIMDTPLPSDVAADHLVPGGRWNAYLQAMSGFINGADLETLSIADYARYEGAATSENWRPVRGYGSLVAASLPRHTPCALSTPVERLVLPDTGGVTLNTPQGDLHARAVILTASTAVLSSGSIRLPDALDPWREAATRLPLGHDEKVFLRILDESAFPSEQHAIGNPHDAATVSYHIRPLGRPMIECFLGGTSARQLAEEGVIAAHEHMMGELVALFGRKARDSLRLLTTSQWRHDTRIGGAYSHALPLWSSARRTLAKPYQQRVFFAGEATHESAFSTAHGAYLSGVRAADEALGALGNT